MAEQDIKKCFVVMPFGKKPKIDGSGDYDFDKVYEVIMKRAIRQAGMEPIRADETKGSRIIHTDMFKDLRDRPVVLVDLSQNNPNVFYELGIRHVMSSRGTVLMCCAGQKLPFDVKLSRTLFYRFAGDDLDWEVAEDTVRRLQWQLEETKRGIDDSPVHLLLDRVLTDRKDATQAGGQSIVETGPDASPERLSPYQEIVAARWIEQGKTLAQVKGEPLDPASESPEKALDSAFGTRALGYWALHSELSEKPSAGELTEIAKALFGFEQYSLANRIFEHLDGDEQLPFDSVLEYASSISEANSNLHGANLSIDKVEAAVREVEAGLGEVEDPEAIRQLAIGYHGLAGLWLWRWLLTRSDEDLDESIERLAAADGYHEKARILNDDYPLGMVALNKLKLLLSLRVRDKSPQRADAEGYIQQILDLEPGSAEHTEASSYLRWYQTIALADAGDEQRASEQAMQNVRNDGELRKQRDNSSIGRRQYSSLRRFLEHWSSELRNPSAIGAVAKILKIFQHS